jgi:uncharacterized protein YbjT (DUF2867 family)
MRILVTGAYGLIGSACLARLNQDDHDLVGAGRNPAEAERRFPYARWIAADFRKLTTPAAWRPLLADIEVVVNCVGVLQDGAGDDTRGVHVAGTCALFDAAASLGIRKIVHLSAIGVGEAGPSDFARTKAAADRHLQGLDLDWVILRPGLVLAPAVYGGTALLRGIAGLPGVTPLIESDARIQVVSIDDVARTVAMCVKPEGPRRVVWQLAHPQVLALSAIVVAIRQWLGFAPARLLRLPRPVGAIVAAIADLLGYLGWRSPIRSTSLAQLASGVVGDPAAWIATTGIRPASLVDILAARPSGVQDRWFARLYFVKPLAIGGLALASISAGVVTLRLLSGSTPWLRPLLAEAGPLAAATVVLTVLGAVAHIVLGLGALVRSTARAAFIGMALVAIAGALVNIVTVLPYASQLWLEYFVIVSAAVPMVLASLVALAILDDR